MNLFLICTYFFIYYYIFCLYLTCPKRFLRVKEEKRLIQKGDHYLSTVHQSLVDYQRTPLAFLVSLHGLFSTHRYSSSSSSKRTITCSWCIMRWPFLTKIAVENLWTASIVVGECCTTAICAWLACECNTMSMTARCGAVPYLGIKDKEVINA